MPAVHTAQLDRNYNVTAPRPCEAPAKGCPQKIPDFSLKNPMFWCLKNPILIGQGWSRTPPPKSASVLFSQNSRSPVQFVGRLRDKASSYTRIIQIWIGHRCWASRSQIPLKSPIFGLKNPICGQGFAIFDLKNPILGQGNPKFWPKNPIFRTTLCALVGASRALTGRPRDRSRIKCDRLSVASPPLTTTVQLFQLRVMRRFEAGILHPASKGPLYVTEPDNDKSIITPEYHTRSPNAAEDFAILRTVIDATGTYLTKLFNNAIAQRLHSLNRSDAAEKAEADLLIDFNTVLHKLPFAVSDSAFLFLAVEGRYITRKSEVVEVPACVTLLWDDILSENPWIRHYVARAGAIRNDCSKVLHGVAVTWKEEDVSVVLAKSDFTEDVQLALRDISQDFNFIL